MEKPNNSLLALLKRRSRGHDAAREPKRSAQAETPRFGDSDKVLD
jgi:hypothetical protein